MGASEREPWWHHKHNRAVESSVGNGEADLREVGARVSLGVSKNQLEGCLGFMATKSPGGKLATEQTTVAGGRDAACIRQK